MPKRSKDQITAQILEICLQSDIVKTKIVYQVNMNFYTINPYLDRLIEMGLLEASLGTYTIYKTTPKGKYILKMLRDIEEIIPECLL